MCPSHYNRWRKSGLPWPEGSSRRKQRDISPCVEPGCDKTRYSKGLCKMHYTRLKRSGGTGGTRPHGPIAERILRRVEVDPDSGCWVFHGARVTGYGTVRGERTEGQARRNVQVHRWAHEHWIGPIPAGYEVDHTCHDPRWCAGGDTCPHRACCNPDHLQAVPPRANSHPDRRRNGKAPDAVDPVSTVRAAMYDLALDRPFVERAAELLARGVDLRAAIAAALDGPLTLDEETPRRVEESSKRSAHAS